MDASARPPPFFVPFSRPDLIGRDEAVERLHAILQQGRPAAVTPALTGQGGIGKTQLAVRYAHDKAGAWPGGVFWLNAAREAGSPVPQLAAFAFKMNLPLPALPGDDAETNRRAALAWTGQVGNRRDALLIADNLDDAALLTRDLPGLPGTRLMALGCTALITTREPRLPGCTPVPLDLLGPEESRALLLREADRGDGAGDEEALRTITGLLGGLPLALRLAGALLRQNRAAGFARVAEILKQRGAIQLLDQAGQPAARLQGRHEGEPQGSVRRDLGCAAGGPA